MREDQKRHREQHFHGGTVHPLLGPLPTLAPHRLRLDVGLLCNRDAHLVGLDDGVGEGYHVVGAAADRQFRQCLSAIRDSD